MPEGALAAGLAVAMLAVAVFCGARMVLAVVWHRPASHDVDLVHVAMGISMAGMLTGSLTGRWSDVWLVVFALSTAWFAWRAVRELTDERPTQPGCGHLPHLVGSASMLYMLVSMQWAPAGAPATEAPGLARSLALPLVVSVLLVLNALFSAGQAFLWSPPLVTAHVAGAAVGGPAGTRGRRLAGTGVGGLGLIAPRCGALCLLAMSGAMAYMFLTLRP